MPNRLNRNSDFPVSFTVEEENVATGKLERVSGLTDLLVGLSLSPTGASIPTLEGGAAERSQSAGDYYITFDGTALRAALIDAYLGLPIFVMLIKPGDLQNEVLDELIISDWDDA